MARVIWKGFAKPDSPIYNEGYSVHIGPLLGTTPPKKEEAKPEQKDKPPSTSRKAKRT